MRRPVESRPGTCDPPPSSPKGGLRAEGRTLWLLVVAGLLLVAAVVVRVRLLDLPLERDEGEYAYAGQLLLDGVAPYRELYSMKWPGTFAAYAVILGVFGQTIAGIHLGLLLVNLGTAALVFLIGRRIAGLGAGSVAAAAWALLTISPPSFGLAGHATHFVVLPALGGVCLLLRPGTAGAGRLFLAGLLFGVAALMKQAGAVFGLFGALWIARGGVGEWRRLARQWMWLAAGALTPLAATLALLAAAGAWDRFWLWTVQYSRAYVSIHGPVEGFGQLVSKGGGLIRSAPGLWILALAGAGLLWERSMRPWRFFLLGFLLLSFLGVCPGWYFRGHYFLLLFPALGLLAGVAVEAGSRLLAEVCRSGWLRALPLAAFGLAGVWFLYGNRQVLFLLSPPQACRALYALNPFPEAVEVGRFLAAHGSPQGRIAVVGSEPELYFYSRRRSVTGYVYTYPLMERQPYARAMQEEMIRELSDSSPDYYVFVSHPSSWLPAASSDFSVIEWFIRFRQERLEPVGLVEIFPDGRAEYSWSGTANPRSDQWLQIYRRKQ